MHKHGAIDVVVKMAADGAKANFHFYSFSVLNGFFRLLTKR